MMDRGSYDSLWKEGIEPCIAEYKSSISNLTVAESAKEDIWREYCEFNTYAKETYMKKASNRLDRHKVCACYIFAIVKAHVLTCDYLRDTDSLYSVVNEDLAITIGLSLLRAFIIENVESNDELNEGERTEILSRIQNGIRLPQCNHGSYRENFASELHFSFIENNYSILSLANTLFLLEIHATGSEVLKERNKGDVKHL